MEHRMIGPGPYRATKLWNETIELFRTGMPQKRHRIHFKIYERCFTATEAVDWLHKLLQCSQNFGPEVTRNQTIQLLKKFQKNHVIEDVKGKWGKEDFEDNGWLYRFPSTSPLKPYPKRPTYKIEPLPFPQWSDQASAPSHAYIPVKPMVMNSELWYKRHSIAIGEVPTCRLVQKRELTSAHVEGIWRSRTLVHLQKILGLDSLTDVMDAKRIDPKHILHNVYNTNKHGIVVLKESSKENPHWLLSAMKSLANWPNCCDLNQPMYSGFERDVFKTIVDYHSYLKEPLLTFHLFDVFVNALGLQKKHNAIEALQVCCLLLPPENRRKLQLLMRMMSKISLNREMPPLCDSIGNRALMVQKFSRCILRSKEEDDLDELLSTKLVTFMMDNAQDILSVPIGLKSTVEDYVAHQRRVQIKYPGSDMDTTLNPTFIQPQITVHEYEYQKTSRPLDPLKNVLEEIISNKQISAKEKKKKLKQFQKAYPQIYKERLPTPECEAALFPEKTSLKSQFSFFTLKRPFQFHRTRSFRL
ncbi:hypothetical protein GDO86_002388 [Hymenochirus boettgeri]|uniref:DEP domain-containing protein 1B n=1 Tax=Hymenochirus boettgeri TaxID=247094 RepID=A0A8T2KMD3_9PIPI|nr:hypothetical protein GDO86_002388 [Hymenochirus boettgeri]